MVGFRCTISRPNIPRSVVPPLRCAHRTSRRGCACRTQPRSTDSYVTIADSIMSKLCDEPRLVTNPNTIVGSYFSADLPDISPDDQRPIDNTERKLSTNSFSWRGVLFSRPSSWKRTSALQLSEEMGWVRYSVRAADTGEGISVCLVLRLEETLRPAYRRIHIEEAWRLVSMLGESDDERGPEAQVRRGLEASDEVLSSVQVSADRNMMLVGRVERGTGAKKVFMFVSELRREDGSDGEDGGDGEDGEDDEDDEDGDRGCFRWCLASVDALS